MESTSLVPGEQRRGGCHCSRCVGEVTLANKGKVVDGRQRKHGGGGAE